MKAKLFIILTLALLLPVLAGCQYVSAPLQEAQLPAIGAQIAKEDTPETVGTTPPPTTEAPVNETVPPPEATTQAAPKETPAPQPTQPAKEKLTREAAKKIALEHAGLEESQVRRLQVEYDRDDGVAKYEVDFEKDRFEYSYDIHAETGKILEADKEYDD